MVRNNKGQFIKGFTHIVTEETRRKISETRIKRKIGIGIKSSEETKHKIRLALKGRHTSPRTELKKGKDHIMFGTHKSDITKAKISIAHLGVKEKVYGETHFKWKGDEAGYGARHARIRKLKGSPDNYPCSFKDNTCKGKNNWASRSHLALPDIDDYFILCMSHHSRYDKDK